MDITADPYRMESSVACSEVAPFSGTIVRVYKVMALRFKPPR